MKVIQFNAQPEYIKAFLDLPKRLYSQKEIMQSIADEEQLLNGVHYLNSYVTLTPFLVMDGKLPLARCMITRYPEDQVCYFGFFECVDDKKVFDCLMDAVERFAMDKQYTSIEGPLNVSLWLGYRFKENKFDLPPYLGEPYNKDYYSALFYNRGYTVKESYVSNQYQALPKENFELSDYQKRWEDFTAKGYEIRSPRPDEWDKCIGEIYEMISVLYTGFLTYHPITREEFVNAYSSYREIIEYELIKIAYYKGQAVGFFMSAPDYGNLSSRKKNLATIAQFLKTKKKPKRYVLLYMGVMPQHRGAGMALTHAIMVELAKKGTPSIGALIRNNNKNFNYASEYITGRYEYSYIERKFTIGDYLNRCEDKWGKENYIAQRGESGFAWHSFGDFAADVRKCAHFLLENGLAGKNIGIYGGNSYNWMAADIAIMGYVGVCFPFDLQYGMDEMRQLLQSSRLNALFYSKAKNEVVHCLKQEFPQVQFFCLEEAQALWGNCSDKKDISPIGPAELSKVIFTSGTSQMPKGVMLTQANMFSNWNALYRRTPMTNEDGILLVLPLNHIYAGVAAFLYSLISGMKIYLGTPHPDICMADFKNLKPSVFIGVPLLAEKMWDIAAKGADASTEFGGKLKYFYCGGAAIAPALKLNYINANIPFIEAYGTSETSSVVALDIVGDYKEGSAGVLMESIEAVIDNPDEHGVGELLVRGGSRMLGYFGLDDLTREIIDDKGYFHTGDLARIDENRHLYLMGRKRRLLITGNSKNVYPQDVEALACKDKRIVRASLYLNNYRLHLKVWYNGTEKEVCEFLDDLQARLPRYMSFETYECIEDSVDRRIK